MTNLRNIAAALASLVIFSSITNAQTLKTNYSVASLKTEEPIKVKYLGDDGEYLLFHVVLQSENPANSVFAIEDNSEGELYSSGLKSNRKAQTVKIEKRNDDQVLNFRLVLGRTTYSKTFSVNTSVVETTVVAGKDITRL